MAEHIRQMRHLWATGFCNTRKKESAYTGGHQRWTAWHYRALIRDMGLPPTFGEEPGQSGGTAGQPLCAVPDHDYLVNWLAWVRNEFIVEQICYHRNRIAEESNIFRKLMLYGLCVFCTDFCSFSGYAKNCQVSAESSTSLEAICREIDAILNDELHPAADNGVQPETLHFTRALFVAEQIHDCCKEELLGWEDVISSRNIKSQG